MTNVRLVATVLAAYAVVALVFSWPLALHFSTHLTGDTAGDTGVYVWNQWIFQRELLEQRRSPYFTDLIFASTGEANLSLHNYTPFQNLLALPLVGTVGVVAAFNTVTLVTHVLTAYVTFLLAHRLTGRAVESWLAGMLFAWSPVLVTRSMGHFSLVAAAPLAAFLLILATASERARWGWRQGVALGLALGWATSTDVYYGVYCLLLGGLFLIARTFTVARRPHEWGVSARRVLDGVIAGVALLVALVAVTGGGVFTVGTAKVSVLTLYTPVLVLTTLVLVRLARHLKLALQPVTRDDVWRAARVVACTAVVAGVVLSPLLYALARRIATFGVDSSVTYWRSSPRGVDLLALVVPNPNHPLASNAWHQWLSLPQADSYFENVASLPLFALGVLGLAWYTGWRPSRWWAFIAATVGLLAVGPFVHIAGVNTFVPGPWAFLRYLPVLGLARTPSRFSVVLMLAVAVLFASALAWLVARWPHRRRAVLAIATVCLCFELIPVPRVLHSAEVPRLYRYVAAAPPDTRVLHLPFGVRDGTLSDGDFSARTQYFQTAHGRSIIGGYLSRVSPRRRAAIRGDAVLDVLMRLSERRSVSQEDEAQLALLGVEFLRRAKVGYVVVDRHRFPPDAPGRIAAALRLELVETEGDLDLYRP